ncbi:MAG: hypothetical protein H6Q13_2488 [Bacteroidetes bacterium]|jgi:hypothetical protein|nr:hypothetical protein [Bacteroidota bacterium]
MIQPFLSEQAGVNHKTECYFDTKEDDKQAKSLQMELITKQL